MSFFSALICLLFFALASADLGYQSNGRIPNQLPQDEFFHFVTRPDLLVPRWNVTTYRKELLSPGYWFTAFYEELGAMSTTKLYVGPQIYDDNGELVWSSGDMFHNADIFDFRIAHILGEERMTFISLYARSAMILDTHYQVIKYVPIGRYGVGANMHDFNMVDNGTRALVLHRNITMAPAEMARTVGYTGGKCQVSSHYIEEADTSDFDHWKSLFKWDMLDHISLNESNSQRGDIDNQCHHQWDYLHANAIDKCPDGNLMLSTRNTDTIFKINRTDGSIIWRMGGYISDIDRNFKFSRQHHVRCHEANKTHTVVSFLDNANGDGHPTNPYSRGLIVSIDERSQKAEILSQYPHPDKKIQGARGSCEILRDGNVLMGWSDRSLLSEHTHDGRIIMTARILPTWLRTYRSYKFPFVGRPYTSPDVVSQVTAGSKGEGSVTTKVYVSWNGATEVTYWNLYKSDAFGTTTELIATAPRNGFETQLIHDGIAAFVIVEALDANGQVLENGRTMPIKTTTPNRLSAANNFESAKTAESKWLQNAEFNKDHPWLSSAKTAAVTPWGMFVAGLFVSAGVIGGVWVALRFIPRKTTWWRQAAYKPLHNDDESGDQSKAELVNDAGSPGGSRSKERSSFESIRDG